VAVHMEGRLHNGYHLPFNSAVTYGDCAD